MELGSCHCLFQSCLIFFQWLVWDVFHTSDMRDSRSLLIKKSVFPYPALLRLEDFSRWKFNCLQLPPLWWLPQWVGSFADGNIDPGSFLRALFHHSWLYSGLWHTGQSLASQKERPLNSSQQFWRASVGIIRGYRGMCRLVCRASVSRKRGLPEDTSTLRDAPAKQIFLIKECWKETVSGAGVPDPNQTEREFPETSFSQRRFGTHVMGTESTRLFCWPLRRLFSETVCRVLSCGTSNENRSVWQFMSLLYRRMTSRLKWLPLLEVTMI